MDTKLDLIDCLCIGIMASIVIWLSSCGYALVKIPEPGVRTSIVTEQRIDSVLETGVETALDPASFIRRRRN